MKQYISLTLLIFLTLTSLPNSLASENHVEVIYFRPNDREPHQDIDAKLDTLLKTVQRFYANEMARNGFDRKTFRLQNDANAKTVVHHVDGKSAATHYNATPDAFDLILAEIGERFDTSRNIYFIAADIVDASSYWRGGGQAYLGESAICYIPVDPVYGRFISLYHAGHELAHTFGLHHDFRDRTNIAESDITSYVGVDFNNQRLSRCAAEWLNVHPYFNTHQTALNEPVTIQMLPPLEYPPNAISLRFEVTDRDGLHQAQLVIPRASGFSLNSCKSLNGQEQGIIEFITTELTATSNREVNLGVIDVNGNFSWELYAVDIDDIAQAAGVINVDNPAPKMLRKVSGDNQQGYLNSRLISPFVVTVRDAYDEPVAGVQVTFQVAAGKGTLSVTAPWTDSDGQVETFLTLGSLREEYRVAARVQGVSEPTIFRATVSGETVATASPLKTLVGHTDRVASVAYSPDGSMIATGSWDRTIRLWDGRTGEYQKTLTGHTGDVSSVAFSPVGLTLASGSSDDTIRLWDVETESQKLEVNGRSYVIPVVAYFPDGSKIASGTLEGEIHVWDALSGQHITSLPGHIGENVTSIAFNPDGSVLASGGTDRIIRLWDTTTRRQLRTMTGHVSAVHGDSVEVVFNHDGSTLASTGGWDRTARLWDAATGEQLQLFSGHKTGVYSVAFGQDGRTLATGSYEGAIYLWDTVTGSLEKTLIGHTDTVRSLVFSPSGNILASGSNDHTVLLWEITPIPTEPEHISADVNRDGVVDIADLVLVASNFGDRGVGISGDVNADGVIDTYDLVLVAKQFGEDVAAAPLHRHVPTVNNKVDNARIQQAISQLESYPDQSPIIQLVTDYLQAYLAATLPTELETKLFANFPNPFNPETWMPYHLADDADVKITIYDTKGAVVRELNLGHQPAGLYTAKATAAYWDGRSETGELVSSGVYFFKFRADDYSQVRRMAILK